MRLALPALALLVALPTVAAAANDDEIKTAMVGSWGDNPACDNGRLTFAADGTFFSGDAEDAEGARKGTYEVKDGVLTGTAGEDSMPTAKVSFEGDTLILAAEGHTDRLVHCSADQ